jgi:hypothetical protein
MDTARLAAMADPTQNPLFARRWTGPPKRRRPALGGTSNRAGLFISNSSDPEVSQSDQAAQRACAAATRRVAELHRRARILYDIGLIDACLRVEAIAAEIREALR